MATRARTTLYSPSGEPYSTADPVEITRLKGAHGYTTTAPDAGGSSRRQPDVSVDEDASKHLVADVKTHVGDDPERAAAALDQEQAATNPRSSLVDWLAGVVDRADADHDNAGDTTVQA